MVFILEIDHETVRERENRKNKANYAYYCFSFI